MCTYGNNSEKAIVFFPEKVVTNSYFASAALNHAVKPQKQGHILLLVQTVLKGTVVNLTSFL